MIPLFCFCINFVSTVVISIFSDGASEKLINLINKKIDPDIRAVGA